MNSYTTRKRLYPYRPRPCYYCGKTEPISREHVPPRMMFASYDCDHITVPACDQHNQQKSGADEKILIAMGMIIETGVLDFPDHPILNESVILEYARLKELFNKAASLASRDLIWAGPQAAVPRETVNIQSIELIEGWIKQLTAGLVWSVTGGHNSNVKWDETSVLSPYEYPFALDSNEALAQSVDIAQAKRDLDQLGWHKGWSSEGRSYPEEIYRFEVSFDNYKDFPNCNVIFKHIFYNGSMEWYLGFLAPEAMVTEIMRALTEIKPSKPGIRKPLTDDQRSTILQIQKSPGISGWNRYPSDFVSTLKVRLGEDFAQLDRLAQVYRLFKQPFFKRPISEFLSAEHEAEFLGFLIGRLGNQLAMRKVFDEAEVAFNISLKLKPQDNPVVRSLANLYTLQGKPQLALKHFEQAEGVINKVFGNPDPLEIEARLRNETSEPCVAMGMPEEQALEMAALIVEQAKLELIQEGHGDTMYREGMGDYLLVNQHDDPSIQSLFDLCRKHGATVSDVNQWHNLSLLEQMVIVKQDELLLTSTFRALVEQGKTTPEAKKMIKKFLPTYTHNIGEINPQDPDDFLPIELKIRVNTYQNSQLLHNPEKFKLELENSSSFNAFIRNKFNTMR